MSNLKQKLIISFGGAAILLLTSFGSVLGQVRTVRVYNARIYNRNRSLTSNRAAVKKTVPKVFKKRSMPIRKKRHPSRKLTSFAIYSAKHRVAAE